MPEIKFKPLPKDLIVLVNELNKRVQESEIHLCDFNRRHFNGPRENAILYCLGHAIDLGKGCMACANLRIPDSATTISRAMLETLFWARYISMSNENAQEFVDSTLNELKRSGRKNLKLGYANIYDKRTNEIKTNEILDSELMKNIPKRISIETAAELGGLSTVYTMIYGYISMIAHGRAFQLNINKTVEEDLYASASTAIGTLQGVEIIAVDWITNRKQTSIEILAKILGY